MIVRINANLYQKTMMANAEIIMFCGVFIGVVLLFIVYCLITRKSSFETKIDVDDNRNSRVHNNSSKRDYMNMNGD